MQEKDEFLMSPKVDFAFKEVMQNEKALRGFLSAVMGLDVHKIKSTSIRNANLHKIHEDEKQSILDVFLTMNDDTEIDIEIQLRSMKTWAERSTFYLCKMITDQPNINLSYSNIHKCVTINLLDFHLFKDTEQFHSVFHLNEDQRHTRYTDILELHVVELCKMPRVSDGTALYDWMRFFTATRREEFEMIANSNEYLRAAVDQLEIISQDEQKRLEYTARQKAIGDYNTLMRESREDGIEEGMAKGMEKGMEKGMAKGRAELREEKIAEMRKLGFTEEQIKALWG